MPPAERRLAPGEPAPDFALPAINREGRISLEAFRGQQAVMLGFFRGLHCPFCRRQIAQLAATQPRLHALGVETLAVVNTPLERAQLYFRHRPTAVTLLSGLFILWVVVALCRGLARFLTTFSGVFLPLLMAVAFGASAAFMTPMGYQTNLLVMNAGGYTFSDFFRIGVPLSVLIWLVLSFVLPAIYGF